MTFQEMLAAIRNGARVTHRHFSPDEWLEYAGPSMFVFEDGVLCSVREFQRYRRDIWKDFEDGWTVVERENDAVLH